MPSVEYVRQAGNDPRFLRKALREVSGEFANGLYGYTRKDMLQEGEGMDDGWCLLGIAQHMLQVEQGVARQFEAIIHARDPEIENVDFDDIPLIADLARISADDAIEEYQYLRRHNAYQLWELDDRHWERGGIHPYLGRITLLDISRTLYKHDLEHMWQMRRMLEDFTRARR